MTEIFPKSKKDVPPKPKKDQNTLKTKQND